MYVETLLKISTGKWEKERTQEENEHNGLTMDSIRVYMVNNLTQPVINHLQVSMSDNGLACGHVLHYFMWEDIAYLLVYHWQE